ncbi:MAG: hypothetical protein HYY17_02015 [Planctomycetes bacterium]|nr:hypothetical protein [Planctomycetota bacterium]
MGLLLLLCAQDASWWSGWKEGSTVTLRTTTVCGRTKLVKEEKFTVARADARSVVVKVETTENGTTTAREDTHHAGDPPKAGGTEKGRQELTVDGKKFACTVLEERQRGYGGDSVTTRWVCPDAPTPAGVVKEESRGSVGNNELTSSFKLVKLNAPVKVKGRTCSCWVVETFSADAVGRVTAKMWYSRDVPGRVVRQERRIESGGEPTTVTVEVVALEIGK